jgi:hypothetical protein
MLANGDECNFGGVSVEIGGTWSGPGENWCWNTVSGVSDIVAISPTPDGQGQWLTGGDGGIFTFGDAPFAGSSGSTALHFPISGMTPTADGQGYQMVGLDGGVLQYGDAGYLGGLGIGGLTGFNYVSGIAADN